MNDVMLNVRRRASAFVERAGVAIAGGAVTALGRDDALRPRRRSVRFCMGATGAWALQELTRPALRRVMQPPRLQLRPAAWKGGLHGAFVVVGGAVLGGAVGGGLPHERRDRHACDLAKLPPVLVGSFVGMGVAAVYTGLQESRRPPG